MSVAAVFNVTDFGTVWLLAACIALNTTSACGSSFRSYGHDNPPKPYSLPLIFSVLLSSSDSHLVPQ